MVPVPSLAHLAALSDADLLTYGGYLDSFFKSRFPNNPISIVEFPQVLAAIPKKEKDTSVSVYGKYKKVADHIRPVPATLSEKFRIVCRYPSNPLGDLPELPLHPPSFKPTSKFTLE